jgi:acyl carrier protein
MQLAGWALPETQSLVVSEGWRLCGTAEVGEIVLRTPFRTLGYLNDPEEQQHRFQPSPFTNEQGDLLYRTGDFGRYEPDASLVIAGRLDDQVKIRGCRVEPGETAAVLGGHPAVRQAVVVPRVDHTGERTLVAYVVANGGPTPASDDLRRFLEQRLPGYMVPSVFVPMEAFPLMPSGKVDRGALPPPPLTTPATADNYVRPRSPVEATLAAVWADLLGRDRIGVHDSFFDLGGHSLMATQLAARVRSTLGVQVSLRDVFTRSTVAELADLIVERGAAGSPVSGGVTAG